MIHIKDVKTLSGQLVSLKLPSSDDCVINGMGSLTLLPGLVDPHVHFRTPGEEYKEDWISASKAAMYGGVTTVFDMPNNVPSCSSPVQLQEKQNKINSMLSQSTYPIRYHLYYGATPTNSHEFKKVKDSIIGIKVYVGCTTGNLLVTKEDDLENIFQQASELELPVTVHAEDEDILNLYKSKQTFPASVETHSKIRPREAAISSVKRMIALAKKFQTRLIIAHLTTEEEVELVKQAKKENLSVYGEVTPHHLFLSIDDYPKWGTKIQCNPPLRTKRDQQALWKGLLEGTLDFIGTDHAPHTLDEKNQPYGTAPSGVPGIETLLPLMLNAYSNKIISLEKIAAITCKNASSIFQLKANDDYVLVDLDTSKKVDSKNLKTKCGWSPFDGMALKGWPVYTILKGKVYPLE